MLTAHWAGSFMGSMEEIINKEKETFLKQISKIQDEQINIFLTQIGEFENNKLRTEYENFSYEIIYRIMELLDGYYNSKLKYELKNIINNTIINKKSNFHDLCTIFLKHN